jgi:hypothetical protein
MDLRRIVRVTPSIGVPYVVDRWALERAVPRFYHRTRAAQVAELHLRTLFDVRWAIPPEVDVVQGPYCASCTTRLRGVLWSGEASEFLDTTREAERQLGATPRTSV